MEYKQHIEKALDYIESNLRNEISIADCAEKSGYSVYHFLRVFKECTGLTPADYIRKRRLSEIAKKVIKGNEYISEIAFSYGFNSKENFLRAFKTEHHILPTEYKSAENSLKLYERFTFEPAEFKVIPKIVTLESFSLNGYICDEDFLPNFWNKYNARGYSQKLSGGEIVRDYGVGLWNNEKWKLEYFIGIKTENAKGDLRSSSKLDIAGGLYAVFSTPVTSQSEFVNNIHKTWEYIKSVWLVDSEYCHTGGYEFECYTEQSREYSEDIYVPIKLK